MVALLLAWVGLTTIAEEAGRYTVSEPAPGVVVFEPKERGIGNTTAIVTDRDVVVIDSGLTPAGASEIRTHLESRTELPIRYVVNTHWHDDHIWGNQVFGDAEILSHPGTRRQMLERAVPELSRQLERIAQTLTDRRQLLEAGLAPNGTPLSADQRSALAARLRDFERLHTEMSAIRPTPATATVEGRLVLRRGDEEVRLLWLGAGHTPGDLVVHLPERRVLVTGDLLTSPFPAAAEASIGSWIGVLTELASFDVDTLIPGHGPVLRGGAYLERFTTLLATVREQVARGVRQGLDEEVLLEGLELGEVGEAFTGGDPQLAAAFERFFLRPAIQSIALELTDP